MTVYGASKLAGEHYSNAFNRCYGLDTTILRLFNNYGPRAHYAGDAGELIPRTILNILYNKQPVVFGDGKNTRDFFYVKDAASALSNLINIPNLKGVTMNVGTGVEATTEEILFVSEKISDIDNIEVIVIDDHSSDNTYGTVEKMNDRRITCLRLSRRCAAMLL